MITESFPKPIILKPVKYDTLQADHPVLWATFKYYLPLLTDYETAIAVAISVGVCPYCHERPIGCQCWNDE